MPGDLWRLPGGREEETEPGGGGGGGGVSRLLGVLLLSGDGGDLPPLSGNTAVRPADSEENTDQESLQYREENYQK